MDLDMKEKGLPSAEQIKAWLRSNGRERHWLAEQLNTTKSVVDSWFSSRGFPDDRLLAISQLMDPEDETSLIRIPFTDEQFRDTQRAAQIVSSDFQDYCQRAINAQALRDLGEHKPQLKVAEDPGTYGGQDQS